MLPIMRAKRTDYFARLLVHGEFGLMLPILTNA